MSQAATKGTRLRRAPLVAGLAVVAALALPGLASGAPGDLDPASAVRSTAGSCSTWA